MIYIVMQSDGCEDTCVSAVFANKEKAEFYAKLKDKLEEDYYYHYVIERELKDREIIGDEEVVEYYTYHINLDDSIEESEDYNDEEDTCKGIDKGEIHTTVEEYFTWENSKKVPYKSISAYSKNSFNEAKQIAIKLYKALKLTEGDK